MNENFKTFIVQIASIMNTILIHLARVAQIVVLQADNVSSKVLAKYSDYVDVFFLELVIELSKNTSMNEYAIELINGKQLFYGPIYALSLVEIETLKA